MKLEDILDSSDYDVDGLVGRIRYLERAVKALIDRLDEVDKRTAPVTERVPAWAGG